MMQEQIILTHTTKTELISEILSGLESIINKAAEKDVLKNEWLTTREVLQVLKISPVTLWNYDKKGLTNPKKVGSRKRYFKTDILQILQSKESRNLNK